MQFLEKNKDEKKSCIKIYSYIHAICIRHASKSLLFHSHKVKMKFMEHDRDIVNAMMNASRDCVITVAHNYISSQTKSHWLLSTHR